MAILVPLLILSITAILLFTAILLDSMESALYSWVGRVRVVLVLGMLCISIALESAVVDSMLQLVHK